jgi:6-pyruvoyltetrahydropterin/6-carboxytetrahydropterin synthase
MNIDVTRWVEFDAGHRVATHGGKCRNLHGHRYVVGVTIAADVVPESGMIVDFGVLAQVLKLRVHDTWDHRFLYDANDHVMARCAEDCGLPGMLAVPGPPTAENIAAWVAELVDDAIEDDTLRLVRVVVRETPKSEATWTP